LITAEGCFQIACLNESGADVGAKSVQQSKPFPLGEYEYAGFDKKGDKIVEGILAITSREEDRIKGEWQLNKIGNPERIGP